MSTIGKNLSFIKRKLNQERTPNVLSRTIVFMHEATRFSTVIDLNSLNLPSEAADNGFANPSLNNIPFLSISRQNIKVESSYKGTLIDYQDYIIVNNTQINLLSPNKTEPGEVFVITITLANNEKVKTIIDSLNSPLSSYNKALYKEATLLRYSDPNLKDNVLNILQYVSTKNREENPVFNGFVETPSGSYPGSNSFGGGVLLPDGRVFCVPNSSSTARIYNPVTSTVTIPSGSYPAFASFIGGVLLPDGRVFCVPRYSTTARIYDPVTDTTTTPSGSYPGSAAFTGGVLLPDGRVFCVPENSTTARIYNPITDTLITPSGTYPGSFAFAGGVLLPDGRVFMVPRNSTTARIYNPVTDTVTTPSGTYPGSASFYGGVLLPDGRVFIVPLDSTTARIYNPVTDTLTTPSGNFPGSHAFVGGVLLPDGRVFCVPQNSTTARIIGGNFDKSVNPNQFPLHILLSPFLNKL
jgi:hypothetical protein